MPDQFLHGVEVIEVTDGARPIRTVASSVIGLIGTAPDSEGAIAASLSVGSVASNNGIKLTAASAGILGNDISVRVVSPGTNSASLAISVSGKAILISLATSNVGAVTTTAAQLLTALAASQAASLLVSGAAMDGSSGAGLVSPQATVFLTGGKDEAFPLNTPVLVAADRALAARAGTSGSLPAAFDGIFDQAGAVIVVVRVAQANGSDSDAATISNVIGTVLSNGQFTGMQALLGAESVLGVQPRILIAPGFTHVQGVLTNLVSIANRLRATIMADGPNTTDAAVQAYAQNFGSDRIFLVDPGVKVTGSDGGDAYEWSSARVAGLLVKSDNDRGFWWSPSNQEVLGIVGTKRPIDFVLGDPASRANILNSQNITTIIRQNGFRLWGNRTLSADPKFAFLSVRRTADMINDSILRAHLWAVDRNITRTYLSDVVEGVNNYLRDLTALGAILGGKCWPDPDLNSPSNIAQGKVFFNFEFTPPYPAEHVTFRSILTNGYLADLIS
jgi:phage tail sheath protein FI